MAADKINRVRVDIGGNEYTLRGTESPEQIREVARYVNDIMTRYADASPHLDQKRVAVLTALNIANDYFKIRQEHDRLVRLLDEQNGDADKGR